MAEELDLTQGSGTGTEGDNKVAEAGVFLDLSVNKSEEGEQAAAAEQAALLLQQEQEATAAAAQAQAEADALAAGQGQTTIDETQVLSFLSEKLGRPINTLEELSKGEERELNPQIKAISEWSERTGRPIEDWVKYNVDYSTMSDADKAREILTLKYPTLSATEVQLELNKYLESEDDLEEDVAMKALELKKLVANEGKLLDDLKLDLGKPIEGYDRLTPELKERLEFAKKAQDAYESSQLTQKEYDENIVKAVATMNSLEINLAEGLNLNYNLSPEDKKELPTFLSEMPHWHNEDGSFNHSAITRDALIIKNFSKMIQMAFEQGKSTGVEQSLKEANNITLGIKTGEGQQPNGQGQGVVIEGLEKFKGTGTQFKFGRTRK